jgi:hypothetical protein
MAAARGRPHLSAMHPGLEPGGCADPAAASRDRHPEELDARGRAIRALREADVPFLVAGAYAFAEYTGIFRDTKDLDLFLREDHLEAAFRALDGAGFRTELVDAGWIGKGYSGEYFVDLIFASGNGVAVVDDAWFLFGRPGRVMGEEVLLAPPEEMIWSKAFVVERERFDGADVNHLLHAQGAELDWDRLLVRFDRHWEVLLAHLMLFRFVYPADRDSVPQWVIHELTERARRVGGDFPDRLCRGPLLSRVQYRHDLEHHGMLDGRRWDERERGAAGPGRRAAGPGLWAERGEAAGDGRLPAGGGR